MTPLFRRFVRFSTALLMVALFSGVPQHAFAQEHVVSPEAIQQQLVKSAEARQQNAEQLNQFFGSEANQKALKAAGISSEQVTKSIAQLSDHELAQLSAKANQAQKDFSAGSLTNQQITYILIALATAVIILVLVH